VAIKLVPKLRLVICSHDTVSTMTADFVLGCDGAFSSVRSALLAKRGFDFNFHQEFIAHAYMLLKMPPTVDGEYAMPANYIHVWPRGSVMMVALPNVDRSFTVVLYLTRQWSSGIASEDDLVDAFDRFFPDVTPLIGMDRLVKDFFSRRSYSMVSVKVRPKDLPRPVIEVFVAVLSVQLEGQGGAVGRRRARDGVLHGAGDELRECEVVS
jgi:kynurenine 3-monooxygenase